MGVDQSMKIEPWLIPVKSEQSPLHFVLTSFHFTRRWSVMPASPRHHLWALQPVSWGLPIHRPNLQPSLVPKAIQQGLQEDSRTPRAALSIMAVQQLQTEFKQQACRISEQVHMASMLGLMCQLCHTKGKGPCLIEGARQKSTRAANGAVSSSQRRQPMRTRFGRFCWK